MSVHMTVYTAEQGTVLI